MPYIGKQLSNGNYLKLDDISSGFNNSTTTFSLTNGGSAYYPGSEFSVLVSVGGSIKEPETAYQINNDQITFSDAPQSSEGFFCIVLGEALGINVPADNTVNGAKLSKPFNYDGGLLYLDDINNRVGINSTSPSVALDVVGDLNVSGNISGIGGTLGSTLVGNVFTSSGISTFNDLLINGDLTVQGDTTTLNTTLRNVELLRVSAASTLPAGIITQTGTGDILSLRDNTTEVFTVKDGGNVGIGTDNPTATLQINSRSDDDKMLRFDMERSWSFIKEGTGANTRLELNAESGGKYFDITNENHYKTASFYTNYTSSQVHLCPDGGNVGIGTDLTTTPSSVLTVAPINSTSGRNISIYTSGTVGNKAGIFFNQISGTGNLAEIQAEYKGTNEGELVLSTSMQKRITIQKGGNVGIGTDSPDEVLHVLQSNTSAAEFKLENNEGYLLLRTDNNVATYDAQQHIFRTRDGSSEGFRINDQIITIPADGKLGINGAAPQSPLDVIANSSGYAVDIRGRSSDDISEIHFCGNTSSPNYAVVGVTTTGGGRINLSVAGSQRVGISSDGRVTMGQVDSSSTSALHIRSATSAETTLELSTKDNYNGSLPSAKIVFTQQNGTEIARIKCDTNTGASNRADLTFWTNYGGLYERLRITETGEVGIGTVPSSGTTVDIDDSGGGVLVLRRSSSNATNKISLSHDGADGTLDSTNNILFRAGGGVALTMKSSGIIGAGGIPIVASALNGVGNAGTFQFYHVNTSGNNAAAGKIQSIATDAFSGSTSTWDADLVFSSVLNSTETEALRIASDGNIGVEVVSPKSKLHLGANKDVRVGGQYGGTSQMEQQVQYSSGYTGVHWMFETNGTMSWCFDGVLIVYGASGSSYGSEVTKITIVYSRESGALNSGDTWRNGTSSYNAETLGHGQVGLNPSAGSLTITEQTDPDGVASTRSLLKLSWSASGQSVGVWSKLIGNFHWASASSGNVEIQDKDANIFWNSNP